MHLAPPIQSFTRHALLYLINMLLILSLVTPPLLFSPTPSAAQEPSPEPAKKAEDQTNVLPDVEVMSLPGGANTPAPAALISISALSGGTETHEAEPNGTFPTATPLGGASVKAKGKVFPANDVDFYSFSATAGDRVYAAVQTLFDASASGDSVLDLLNTDGTTVIETDPNDGTFNASSSTIAGATIPSNGTYFLRVRHNVATGTIRPYDLHFNLLSGAPLAEVEPNNTAATATPLPASGWVSGNITAVSPGEADFYSLTLAAGDSVYLSLDMNPERDANVWNGRLGFGMFGNPPSNQLLLANDANAGASAADPNSEAFFFTVLTAGTYYVYVDSIVAAGLGANATYNLSVAVYNPVPKPGPCTTYTNNTPVAIPSGPGSATSNLTIPGNPRIADLDVSINLNHTFMQDLDVHLVSPAGNDNGLFTDIGAGTVGGPQTLMDIRLDDNAALPFAFAMSAPMVLQPELAYRLGWFNGEDAGGTWTLVIRDDATGDAGTLNSWSLTLCEPLPASGAGQTPLYSSDFESGAAGFTHSGAQDEWELGLPTFGAITTCNSGVNCWKTDLDNTHNASSSQDLISPNINLAGLSGPIRMQWAMRYHLESANFDHVFVEAREVGNPSNAIRVFDWLDATMNNTVGNPTVTIAESAGWAIHSADISALAGLNIELRFHLDSDTTVQLAGLAIDDVQVTGPLPDLSLNKSVSPTGAAPGQPITYTLTFSNTGLTTASGVVLTDSVPISLTNLSVSSSGAIITDTGASPAFVWQVQDLAFSQGGTITITGQISPNLTNAGVFTNSATITATGDISPSNNTATVPVSVVIAPEIAVLGNGQVIADGDTTPSATDHTDFGPVTLGQALIRTFTISNSGVSNLNLTGSPLVTITGPAAVDFSLLVLPTTPIAPNNTVTFQVQFSPSLTGTRIATLSIASDDSDENPYDFTIQGVGTTTSASTNLYLPLILKSGLPDLVVKQIIATRNNVQVVIQNQGGAVPVNPANEFWVDLYVNPAPPPSGVNQTCTSGGIVCEKYAVWGVTQTLLPQLTPGGVITLTIGDAYQTEGANPISLTPGSAIYAQVDSDNALTTYGAIQESSESNNISSTLSTAAVNQAVVPSSSGGSAAPSPYLPLRSR
ncbi:MAG: choice-of-anchor D domain-containing protein [Anaerolineae bacterium]|nr:choice-of-anchor D domain-containing protein [Anaerolineae bacterium]